MFGRLQPKLSLFLFILFVALLGACQSAAPAPSVEPVGQSATPSPSLEPTLTRTQREPDKSSPTPGITHIPTDTPDEIDQNCCAEYHIAILGAPTTLNYWRYLGEDHSVWTAYVISDEAPSLYEYPALRSPERPDFVPALAADLPPQAVQVDDLWMVPVNLIESATWSDGKPLTAHDVVFTFQTVFDLQLGGRWLEYYSPEILASVEAAEDHIVEFYFYDEPGLAQWQFSAAMGPILPQHYWDTYVQQASTFIEGVAPPETCQGVLALEQLSDCQAFAKARQSLYSVELASAPSGGGYITIGNTSNSIHRKANPYFYADGFKISLYEDGTWERIFSDGTQQQLYGSADGDPVLTYRRGPYSPSVKFSVYDSHAVAYGDLLKGTVDTVLNPSSLTDDWMRQTAKSDEITQYIRPQNGLAYLAFNLRRPPLDRIEFRQAVEVLIDQEKIALHDLEDRVFPAYAIVPEENAYWQNPLLGSDTVSMSKQERLDLSIQILKDAGWSWKVEPSWDATSRQILPGEDLRTPDKKSMSETSFIFPNPDEDVLMAAFGQEVADLLFALGVPLIPESLSREAIVNRALIAGGSFDLYLLDWYFPLYPGYLCALFYSENDTILTGGYNTTGYDNPDFDKICDRFLVETDFQTAQEQAHQMQVLLADDRPYISLLRPQVVDLIRERVVIPYVPQLDGLVGAGGLQTDARVLIK